MRNKLLQKALKSNRGKKHGRACTTFTYSGTELKGSEDKKKFKSAP